MPIKRKNKREGSLDIPPHISFKTFSSFVDRLRQRGKPNRIDRSFLAFLSGSNQTYLLAALRYLDLISENGVATDKLDSLVKSVGSEYPASLRNVLEDSYPFLFKRFDLRRATLQEVEDKFSGAGASGDNLRECVTFFMSAAKAAEVPTSPFIRGVRRRKRFAGTAPERDHKVVVGKKASESPLPHAKGLNTHGCAELLASKFPQFDPTWTDEIKVSWFESFQKLMERLRD